MGGLAGQWAEMLPCTRVDEKERGVGSMACMYPSVIGYRGEGRQTASGWTSKLCASVAEGGAQDGRGQAVPHWPDLLAGAHAGEQGRRSLPPQLVLVIPSFAHKHPALSSQVPVQLHPLRFCPMALTRHSTFPSPRVAFLGTCFAFLGLHCIGLPSLSEAGLL